MADDRKTWAVILGTAAGVAAVTAAIVWYAKTHSENHPIKDVQEAISRAYDKIKEIEQIATLRPA